jgi:hypothetical protein
MYKCSKCGLGVIIIPATKEEETKIIRACPHEDASIVADMTATVSGQAIVVKE